MNKPERISKVSEQLYLGGHFYVHYSQNKLPQLLQELGITAVINCAEEIEPIREEKWSSCYHHYRWSDHPHFQLWPEIDEAEAKLNRLLEAGKRVYVHCSMGISRSPSLVLYHLVKQGKAGNFQDALTQLTAIRPSVAMINTGFKEQLSKLLSSEL